MPRSKWQENKHQRPLSAPLVSEARAKSGRPRHWGCGPARSLLGHETSVTYLSENGVKDGWVGRHEAKNYGKSRLRRQVSEPQSKKKRRWRRAECLWHNDNRSFCLESSLSDFWLAFFFFFFPKINYVGCTSRSFSTFHTLTVFVRRSLSCSQYSSHLPPDFLL